MTSIQIRRLPVWSKSLRLCHWSMALATLILLLSGWLMAWAPDRAEQVRDVHFYAAALLIAGFLARVWLLFAGKGSEHASELLPNQHRLRLGAEVLRSYLTLGRLPLPRWYAHNPLWAPLYLLLFIVLLTQIGSGLLLLNQITLIAGVSLRSLHGWGYLFLLGFTLLHIAAVFFHDAKSTSADLSGMVNGHRLFVIEPRQEEKGSSFKAIPLDALKKELELKGRSPDH